jgi:hypothetical protein
MKVNNYLLKSQQNSLKGEQENIYAKVDFINAMFSSILRVTANNLSSRLFYINDKIPFELLNKQFESYKIEC